MVFAKVFGPPPVVEFAVRAFLAAGVEVDVVHTKTGYELHAAHSDDRFTLDRLLADAERMPKIHHQRLAEDWVRAMLRSQASSAPTYYPPTQPPPAQGRQYPQAPQPPTPYREVKPPTPQPPSLLDRLHQQLRTRVFSTIQPPCDLSYAPELGPGLLVGLCLDLPTSVSTLNTDSLPQVPGLAVADLYRIAQANTDAEPITQHSHVGDGVQMLVGDSWYVSAKAANFPALVGNSAHSGNGIVFSPICRNTLIYAVLLDSSQVMRQVQSLATLVQRRSTEASSLDGGLTTADIFYRATDGTVERLGGPEYSGQQTSIVMRPGPRFARLVSAQTPPSS